LETKSFQKFLQCIDFIRHHLLKARQAFERALRGVAFIISTALNASLHNSSFVLCYNTISQRSTAGKESDMLQQVTIQTSDIERFKPLLETALDREAKLLEYSIQRTREALAPFEARNSMTTEEFERKFKAREIEETLDYLDWWMEVEALRHLEAQRQSLKEAKLD
jgi:hypothetical protein